MSVASWYRSRDIRKVVVKSVKELIVNVDAALQFCGEVEKGL